MQGSKKAVIATREHGHHERVRIQHSSEREAWVIDHLKPLGLQSIFSATQCVDLNALILPPYQGKYLEGTQVTLWGDERYSFDDALEVLAESDCLIASKMMGGGNDCIIELKLGSNVSYEGERGKPGNEWKALEQFALDKLQGGKKQGFEIKQELKKSLSTFLKKFPNAHKALDKVKADLSNIRAVNESVQNYITFVDARMLIVLNADQPALSAAKLIEANHPIIDVDYLPKSFVNDDIPDTIMEEVSSENWGEYYDKRKKSFEEGLKNLELYLS